MADNHDELREQIIDKFWLGKKVLTISEDVFKTLNAPRDWFESLPPIKFLKDKQEEAFKPAKVVIDSFKDFSDAISSTGLLTLETIYGVNKAFNSSTHNDLKAQADSVVENSEFTDTERSLYIRGIDTWNKTLDLPQLSKKLSEMEEEVSKIERMAEDANQKIEQEQDRAIKRLETVKAETIEAIENAEGEARKKLQRILSRVKKTIEKVQEKIIQKKLSEKKISQKKERSPKPRGAIILAPMAAVAAPGVLEIMTLIYEMSSFFLGSFILKSVVEFPAVALGALAHTTTSVVCKFFGSVGAEAARYLAASTLKFYPSIMPVVAAETGMFASAWAFLLAYAPYIIAVAAIVIVAIKIRQKEEEEKLKLAEHFYVIADDDKYPGIAYASIANPNDIKKELMQIKKDILAIADRTYNQVLGVVLDGQAQLVKGYDLTNDNPLELTEDMSKKSFDDLRTKHKIANPTGVWRPI